jgi:hypothetical protein
MLAAAAAAKMPQQRVELAAQVAVALLRLLVILVRAQRAR